MSPLDLFLHDEQVGLVEPARDKTRVTLNVDRGYAQRVLLSESFATLPGRRPATDAVTNFLGGYVPEGNHRERPAYEALDDDALAIKLKRALEDSDQGIEDDSRSSLPGYQPKVLATLFNDQWAYPHGRAHSTHILKPEVPDRPQRIFDEHYSHLLTQHMGLSQSDSQIRTAGRTTYLAIERFDRTMAERLLAEVTSWGVIPHGIHRRAGHGRCAARRLRGDVRATPMERQPIARRERNRRT